MGNLFKIAVRNLLRYKRRTLLTASLITVGVVFVLVFMSVSGSFKNMMIGQITDSMLGHVQVHRKGYVASIDNLPLNLNLKAGAVARLEKILDTQPEIAAYSPRIKFGGMFSTFAETTNIRLNGVIPEKEFATVPLLPSRIIEGEKEIKRGEILIPELLAKGMKVKVGDTVVIVATNKDGSVNGKQFQVGGILQSVTGPGGRDGYIHFDDAAEVLRMIMAVYERIREIGTIAAIGTPPGKILSMFVLEGFCLGIVGAVIGTVVGTALVSIINLSRITFNFGQQKGLLLQAHVNGADILAISVTVVVVSVIASLQPAFKASRMEPIKALRHV